MKLFVGVTNNDWFRFLSERKPDEVNFWRPRSQTDFKALQPGDLFLFKLHSPLDFIAGGGVFVRHSFLLLPLAVLPRHEGSRPAPEFLEWHQGIFKG